MTVKKHSNGSFLVQYLARMHRFSSQDGGATSRIKWVLLFPFLFTEREILSSFNVVQHNLAGREHPCCRFFHASRCQRAIAFHNWWSQHPVSTNKCSTLQFSEIDRSQYPAKFHWKVSSTFRSSRVAMHRRWESQYKRQRPTFSWFYCGMAQIQLRSMVALHPYKRWWRSSPSTMRVNRIHISSSRASTSLFYRSQLSRCHLKWVNSSWMYDER